MEKNRAIKLLDNVFNKSFDESRFSSFIGEVFNKSVSKFGEEPIPIEIGFKEYIVSGKLLKIYDIKKGQVAVISVKMKKTSSRDLARTMQRNFVARYIETKGIKNALVAFYDSSEDWRFSFIEVNYKLDSKGKPIKIITGAKRSSFLVGPNEPNHTCKKQFMPLLQNLGDLSIEELRSVFEIEKVTKEFFREYKEHFLSFVDSINKLIKKDKIIGEEFLKQDIDPSDFVKKLMGQLVFLYFIQKKGWLGVDKNTEWGTGNTKFLTDLFKECKSKNKNFFNDYLEYLFYNALAKDRRANKDYFPKFGCRIPFLNGGLFEPYNNYDWEKTDITLDNNIFEKLFDFLNRYNFTIKEDEPLDREVAVDPEMLGKVFENLLEIKDRKSKGAFYTPREIVHYMCQQSLLNYLETNTKIKRKDLEKFVLEGDNYLELTKLYASKKVESESDWALPKSIKQNYELLDKLLTDIKVVDPAVGSGAFPMGMMNELVKLRQILSIYFSENKQKTRTDYNLKRSTIENCIYGVDIMPSAVEICKLRFWLSLVIDESGDKIEPLPNLENKLRIGNSLLEEFEGVKLFDERLLGGNIKPEYIQSTLNEILKYRIKKSEEKLRELKKLHKKFFNEEDNREKNKLRNTIDRIEWELIEETLLEQGNEEALDKLKTIKKGKSKPFFLWKLYFAEVFQRENPGFDVVIANPPYVGEKGNKEIFRPIANSEFGRKFYHGKMDLFYFFFHKSIDISRENASVSFITTNYYPTAYGARNLRIDLKNRTTIREIINFNELRIFETARGQHNMITIFTKDLIKDYRTKVTSVNSSGTATNETLVKILNKKDNNFTFSLLSKDSLFEGDENYIRVNLGSSKNSIFDNIFSKMVKKSERLGEHFRINNGIHSQADYLSKKKFKFRDDLSCEEHDGIYVLDSINKNDNNIKLKIFKSNESKYLKPFFKNSDIFKYFTKLNSSKHIIYINKKTDDIEILPNIKKHLMKFKKIIDDASDNAPYLHRPKTNEDFHAEKIVVPQRSKSNVFGYNNIPWYASADVYFITQGDNKFNLKFTLSLLNSKLYYLWLYTNGKRKGNSLELYKIPLSEIPIKKISLEDQKPFIQLVNQILSITKDEDYLENPDKQDKVKKLEKEIDKLVYDLYELTPEEIKIVEDFFKK